MISIVITGRNDNYGGDFKARMFLALHRNVELLERYAVDYEIVFVEWNPIEEKPYVCRKICSEYVKARAFVVPFAIHQAYSTNPQMPFCEMPAKNIGIREAMGDSILVLNADIVLSESIVEEISQLEPLDNVFYRARRVDIEVPCRSECFSEEKVIVLSNGEELIEPVAYLGAGGDFCFATKSAFLKLGGYDESSRFTTRAKDWQFFLNALQLGFEIEFVGKVYHIDHGEGFRNTQENVRNTAQAHFGSFWNFELELPFRNPDNWGMQGVKKKEFPGERIHSLLVSSVGETRWNKDTDRAMKERVLPANGSSGWKGAQLMHLLLQILTKQSSFKLHLNQLDTLGQWQLMCRNLGISPDKYLIESSAQAEADVVELQDELNFQNRSIRIPRFIEGIDSKTPQFNPFLLKRLMRAYLFFIENRFQRILVYGAGEHTLEVLKIGIPKDVEIVGVVVTKPSIDKYLTFPCFAVQLVDPEDYDAVLISSISFEGEMLNEAKKWDLKNVYPLYSAN